MAPGTSRPRSSTSASTMNNRPRPISRASATGNHSSSGQLTHGTRPVVHVPSPQMSSFPGNGYGQYTPEEMISNSETQLKNPDQRRTQSRDISVDTIYSANNDATKTQLTQSYPHDSRANTFASADEDQKSLEMTKGPAEKKQKGSSSSLANDQELRRLFSENCHRDLRDVAASVLASEGTNRIEKTKQIFAMNWLSIVCKKSSTSVPRNRVYAQYAQRCGTERVPLLNPASFGKLVRIIFPDITTRRLGMRGESKYHYVDLALSTDEVESSQARPFAFEGIQREKPPALRNNQGDTAAFPPPDMPFQPNLPKLVSMPKRESTGYLFLDRINLKSDTGVSREKMISRQLKFPTTGFDTFPDESPISLPEIKAYIPTGTDLDTAASLQALYRSHCISIIDCVRYCKERSFWHHFTSFHGTLTVPVQKLFSHPQLAPWIRECDWLMYQKMVQFVSPLALQVMPELVIKAFQCIADGLGRHILHVFNSHPQHVRDAKHGPAVIFAGLLSRLIRVNAASHAAAHILGNDSTREQMWQDWVYHVKPATVAESCLPGVGYTRCIQILTNDLRGLLSPLAISTYPGMQQIFDTPALEQADAFAQYGDLDDGSTSSVLDRWVTFLYQLPSRFPNADARTLLHCVSDVGTAALRDITMATAVSFGQWTVTKVWVDEMMQWLAEKGGFLENSPRSSEPRPNKRSATEAGFQARSAGDLPWAGAGTRGGNAWQNQTEPSDTSLQRRTSQSFNHHISPDLGSTFDVPHPVERGRQRNWPGNNADQSTSYLPREQSDRSRMEDSHNQTQGQTASQPASRKDLEPTKNAPTSTASGETGISSPRKNASPWRPQLGKEFSFDEPHEDSGIGLELELPRQQHFGLAEYGGFVNNTNSDPPDVVVC